MRIESDEFTLRDWEYSDAEALARIADNPKIACNLTDAFPQPYRREDAVKYIQAARENNSRKLLLAIEADGQIAGSFGVIFLEDVYRQTAEIAYYLGEQFWGRGLMTKIICRMTDTIFLNYPIIRVQAEPFSFNTASCRVLEKAGFMMEARKKLAVTKNGQIYDSFLYSKLSENLE